MKVNFLYFPCTSFVCVSALCTWAAACVFVGTAMMPQYYNAGQTPWGIYLATPVAPQTPQATPSGQPAAAPLLRGQHTVTARPMTPIQTATPIDDSSTPQMHATPGMISIWLMANNFGSSSCVHRPKVKVYHIWPRNTVQKFGGSKFFLTSDTTNFKLLFLEMQAFLHGSYSQSSEVRECKSTGVQKLTKMQKKL